MGLQESMRTGSRPLRSVPDIDLLAWTWMQRSPAASDLRKAPERRPLIGSATPLALMLSDGTKISALRAQPGEFECVAKSGSIGAELVSAARRGIVFAQAAITLRSAVGDGRGTACLKLTKVRVKSVTMWGPGFGPREGLVGGAADRPLHVFTLHSSETELQTVGSD